MSRPSELPEVVVKTSEVINVNVLSPDKKSLGKVEEILLDKVNGVVKYVVLSFGGFLGLGNKLFALPWKSLQYDPTESSFILNVSKEKLENAPGFDKDHWPTAADPIWRESEQYFL